MASAFKPQVANFHGEYNVRPFPVQAGQTFVDGALVVFDPTTNHTISECGANPALIAGISGGPASVALDSRGSIYGATRLPVFLLNPYVIVWMSSTTTPVYATHVGNKYGIQKNGNFWQVNIADTVNTRVEVLDVSPAAFAPDLGIGQEGFLVKFLGANLQFNV